MYFCAFLYVQWIALSESGSVCCIKYIKYDFTIIWENELRPLCGLPFLTMPFLRVSLNQIIIKRKGKIFEIRDLNSISWYLYFQILFFIRHCFGLRFLVSFFGTVPQPDCDPPNPGGQHVVHVKERHEESPANWPLALGTDSLPDRTGCDRKTSVRS